MTQVALPKPSDKTGGNKSSTAPGTEQVPGAKTGVDANAQLQEQLTDLANQIGDQNKARKDQEAAEKLKAEKEEQERLDAESSLRDILKEDDEIVQDAPKTRKEKIDDMSNSEVMDILSEATETALNARFEQAAKDTDKKLDETNAAIKQMCNLLSQMQTTSVLERARSQHADFDNIKTIYWLC
jgi:hypothetical protein